jgi:hypothetical protein
MIALLISVARHTMDTPFDTDTYCRRYPTTLREITNSLPKRLESKFAAVKTPNPNPPELLISQTSKSLHSTGKGLQSVPKLPLRKMFESSDGIRARGVGDRWLDAVSQVRCAVICRCALSFSGVDELMVAMFRTCGVVIQEEPEDPLTDRSTVTQGFGSGKFTPRRCVRERLRWWLCVCVCFNVMLFYDA